MGKNNVNKRFTVDLEISTSDAEKKVRATVGNLKTILSDLGNASDKMGYFKELVDYISQIDKALVALKVKHGDTFNNLFDGLDVSLKGEMEKLFGTTSEVMNAVEMIRSQIEDAGKNKTSVGNLRKIATAINDLFSDLGIDEQINIDKYFKGSGDLQARLSILNDALDKFATTWTNVNAKVKQGFGVGGNGNTGLSEGVKREVDALNEQIRKLQEAKQKVEDLKKTIQNIKTKGDSAISDVYSIDVSSTESVKNLMDEFDRLNAEIQSGDKTTAEYYLNLVRITEAALSLKKALKDIRANDSIKQQYINEVGGAGFSGTLLGKLSTYANQKTTGALDSIFNVKIGKGIDDVISAILVKIQDLKSNDTGSGSGGSGSGDGNGTGITKAEFSALETAIKTGIDTLSQKLDGTLKVELTNEVVKSTIDNVEDVVNSIVGELKSENASDDNGNLQSLLDTLGSLSDSITSLVDNLNSNVNADTNGGGVKYDSISGRMFHGTRVKWTGDVYDPNREKAAAFGAALYVTPDEKAVKNYGSAEIKELEFSLDKCFIITKDYITSLGDIYKAMGTTVPEGADIQKALSDMRSYCRASIDNSKAFKQEMLSMGYQGMYVGDNLNNIKMKEEVAIYDEKVLKKLKSYTGAEFTEKGITGVVDVNIVGGAEVIQDSLRSDVSDSGDKQAITIDAELDNAVNQVIAALNRLQESIDGTASYIQGVAESVTKDIDGGKNNDAINSNVTDAVGTQAIEQQSWTERAESIQNITAALDKQKVSYEELIAAVNAYKDAYEIMQKFTPDGGLGLELMNNLRTKFKFGQNLDLIDTDNWSRLLEGKISAEEIAIQLKPYLDESNLKKEKSVLKKDFKQYVQSLVDTGDFSLRDDTDLDMWDSIEEGIKEGTLTTLDQCVTKFKELKAITEAAEESTDAENASLERKLELLRDIAEQYANDITQRDRNTYERLNDKEMESGLTSKEEVRYSKLGEKISDADEQLEQFGETYDKILLKLANGKTIKILPEDAGLRKFDKIANEFYQGEYDGIEIEDVIFMRKQEQSVIEQNNQELQKQLDIQEQIATAQGRASGPQQAEIVADNEKAITSYEELCQVVKRYNELCLKSFAEGQTLTDADRVEKSRIKDKFMATKGVLGDPDKFVDYIISMQRLAGLMGEYDTNRLAKYFGIEIPQAADKATEAIQEVTQATESSSIPQDTSASTAKYEAETKVVKQQNEELEINQQLKAQEGTLKTKNTSDDSQNNDIKQSIGTMISALTENIKALKDATNGVIDQQKAQKTDTTAAMARIKDKQQYDIISNTATMSIGDLGTETQIKGLTALANGLVKVEGAFKNAEGEWEGFTVKVNKSNEAVDLATNKQSAFAKALNKVKDEISEVDDNPVKYNPDETYKKALEHMKELNAAGKNATLQYQDSGRYTVSSKEQVGGLSKEIFTTFDEFQKVMSRTTVTLSNDIASSIRDANKLISDNTDKVGNEGLLKQYNDEYANLIAMNQKYESMDNLSQDDIAVWNSKITLVQRLGNEVSGLIKQQQKLEGQSGIATSAKRLQEYQTEADKVFKELDFGLTTENKTDVQQKIVGIYDQIIEKINLLKKNHSILTESQQSEINGLLKSLKEEANAYNEANKSVEEIKEEPQTGVKKKKTAEETVDIKNNIDELKQLTAQLKKAKQDLDFTFSDQNLNDDQQGIVTSYKEAQIEIKKLEEAVENGEQVELGSIQATISALQTKIAQYKQANNLMSASEKQSNASSLKTKLTGSINTLDFKVDSGNLTDEQQSIANKYKELNNLLQQYGRNASEVSQEEYNNTIQRVVALNQEIAAYKKKYNIANARGGTQTSTYGTTQVLNATSKYNSLLSDAKALGMSESSTAVQNYTNALQNLVKAQQAFKAGEDTTSEVGKAKVQAFKDAQIECSKYAKELNNVVTASKKLASNGSDTYKLGKDFEDTKSGRESALRGYIESLGDANIEIGKFQNASNELTYTIKNSDGSFTQMTATINAARTAIVATTGDTKTATSAFGNFISELKNKAKGITTYLISMTGFQEVFQQLRQGVQYVKEIDSALTELKKVTDETDATYERFLQTMSKTAGVVGSTVSELTTMASEWARLGYSIEEAGQLAESTAILLNVSEFENATDASEALISTMQAFQYTADESQHVVDILNEVGNNYAVSSDGIATALQDSASALMEAGNNLEQSVALIAAANKVVQDPNSVGSALRTISLRLRGTSVEVLEEMGEETDGAVESISKLQEKIKALSGVNILTDSGAYKDTYTILKEIGAVWEDMNDIDKSALLELMAGKNRANTLAAILGNMEDLEGAYKSALNAEGSAMRENEAYLDSIQGRIDLFNNALQTFWMNTIDSSAIKGVVDLGTKLVQLLDTVHGKILAVVAALMTYKKIKDGVKFTDMFKGAVDVIKGVYTAILSIISGTKSLTVATVSQSIASKITNKELAREILINSGLSAATEKLTKKLIKTTAETLTKAYADGKLTAAQYLATMSTMGLKTALQGLWTVLKANPIYFAAAAIAALALAIDHFHTTAQEAADAAKEAFDEIQNVVNSTKSTIQSLESELSTLQDKINALDGKQLSFAEDQELEKLKKQREELEHSLKVQEQLLELQRESSNKQAVASMKAYTKAASEGAKETQDTAKAWGTIGGVISGALLTLGGLALIPVSGGSSSALSAMGVSTIATTIGIGAAAGGLAGNKAGEAIGSSIAENDGTYDSWYETYTKALETARKEEQKALEKYKKDSSNIDKLDKWREAQQKASSIETEMYEHLSQMQQYFNGLEYGPDEEINKELDAWYNFLDKFSIDQGASGAEVTALDRIFGENASEEIQLLKEQILDAVSAGRDFDFTSAINGSQELNSILNYVGLTAEDVKNYFTQIGEAAANAANQSKEIISFKTYSELSEEAGNYKEILSQSAEIVAENTKVTQDYKDSLIELIGSEEAVNECFYEDNKLVVKNEKALKDLLRQAKNNISSNVKLAKSQSRLKYYELVKQLNDTLNSTKQLDGVTKDSIYTLLDQIDTVELAIYQYQLLEDSLLGATNAFDEFAKAQEIDSLNTYGDSYVEMVQTMYDALYKTGQVGAEQFQAAVKALVPDSIYQGLAEEADRMQAIFEYFNKSIVPTLNLKDDAFSMDYESIDNFVDKALEAKVLIGDVENFDLAEGMHLEKAAELMGMTTAQAYAFFAELDKYNTGSEQSFLSQLDDSLDGRIMNIITKMEELNRQKLALLEDGGYDKNKEAIDSINQQLTQCDQNLVTVGIEARNMWQEYSKNDIALKALESIQNKQQEITKEGAATLGLEWDEVKGKTIQQIYDEILAKQQQLGVPTELTLQFAKQNIESELSDLEKKLKEKTIDIEANVVWNEKDKQYEAADNSQYVNDEDLQKYISLQNEGYSIDNYLESAMTATEEYLSNIQNILQSMYDFQTGKDTGEAQADLKQNSDTVTTVDAPEFNFDDVKKIASDIGAFFTDTVPEVAGDVYESLNKFFTETVPQEWNDFWNSVGEFLAPFGDKVQELYNVTNKFFTETIPQAWNEFWAGVGESLTEFGNNVEEVYNVVSKFFKETIPQKWEEFWNGVGDFLTQDAPYAIGYAAGVVAKFFTQTIPEKWDEFWSQVGEFLDEVDTSAQKLHDAISEFFFETIPEKWNEMWESINQFYEEVIDPVVEDLKDAVLTFFNETLPTNWNEFWNSVDTFFTVTIPNAANDAKDAINNFFTVTLPGKWNAFWDSVGQFINTSVIPALSLLQSKLATFFTETIPTKWNAFLDGASAFFTETIPNALQQFGNKIEEFFTVTIPAKWSDFWASVDAAFVTPIATAVQTIGDGITNFFTVTVPNAINGMWGSLSSWISEKASSIWSNLTAGFTAGFGGGGSGANGTAHAHGTAHARGTANKSGSWGAPKTETALVGELGPELLVRNGRWTTVGDNGAEFTQVKKGDIIFNHLQTKELLSKGYVTGRGKAYASGTAYSGLWKPTSPDKSLSNSPGNDFSTAASSLSNAADDISDAADEFEEVFDWIEVRLEEINEKIDLKSAKLDNAVGSTKQNAIVNDMIELNKTLYDNLIAGSNEYYAYAKTLLSKIPASYREAAQNGSIAIEKFVGEVDEETLNAIQEYREWVQKGADATQQAEEVITEISTLAKQAIDNIAEDYDNKASIRSNEIDQLDAYNALAEAKYGSESERIYQEMIKETNKNIKTLQQQRDKMQAELNKQVEAGNIQKYSQDWYDAVNDIAAVDTEIINLTADTYDYQDSINELHWDHFDNLLSRFEAISDEADNLIDMLGNKDLVDKDTAEWTKEGITSLGLYAQKIEVAEMQAKKYKDEINYLNKNWKKLGYTEQEYVEKLEELKEGQYDSIKAYEDTKKAIVDLNKERIDAIKSGIEREIEAYEKLINKKKEELDADKDIHDFQKNVADQQKNISDIERKIAALSSDNSASARAKRAKLEAELIEAQAELQETYYDRSITDQQDALDKELENFKDTKDKEIEGWDEYLENTEQVIADSLSTIQTNTDVVYNTLKAMGKEYSLSIADSLTSPWKDGENAIQSFSEKFGLSMSSTVEELQKLADEYKKVMDQINDYGNKVVDQVNDNVASYQAANNPTTSSSPVVNSPSSSVNQPSNTPSTAGMVSSLSGYLQYGQSGSNIKKLQTALNDLGFNAGTVDGIFGYNTKQAVMRFQSSSKYGGAISADGIVGPDTKKKFKAAGYASGTTGVKKDQLALIDELGEELQLIPDGNGRLAYLKKGTAVIPHDISENLMQLGQLDPQDILDRNRPTISAPYITNNNIELNVSFGEVVHIEHVDNDAVPNLAKTVEKQIDKYMKNLNGQIRKYTR